jgi:hypothetical protein
MERPKIHGPALYRTGDAEEVDALWTKVKDRAKVIYAVDNFDYGAREFGITDDNGYSLAFGAPLKS